MTEQVRIDLVAKDDASKVIDKVADKAEDLEKLSPEIEITADGDAAAAGIREVADAAEALSKRDAEIVLRARIDAAKGDLKALRDDLDQTSDQARRTDADLQKVGGGDTGGLKTRGNAIADLTGPLGEASGAASDFAGVFDGLGDIVEDAAGKMGASAAQAAQISGAVGGIGIAVAGAAALWSLYTSRQEAARKKQEELIAGQRNLNEALREGNIAQSAKLITETYADAYTAAKKFGASAQDVTNFLIDQSQTLPGVTDRMAELKSITEGNTAATDAQRVAAFSQLEVLGVQAQKIYDQRAAYLAANDSIAAQDALLREVGATLDVAGVAAQDATGKWTAFKGATFEAGKAAANTAAEIDGVTKAQQRLRDENDRTAANIDRLRGKLDMEQQLNTFRDQWWAIMAKLKDGVTPTVDEVIALKRSIVDVGETAGATDVELEATLKQVDQGDMNAVALGVTSYYNRNPVVITSQLKLPPLVPRGNAGQGGGSSAGPTMVPVAPGASTVIVNQSIPRGYRGDVLGDAERAARRSGGLYRRSRR